MSGVIWFIVVELEEVSSEPGLPVRPKRSVFSPGEHGETGKASEHAKEWQALICVLELLPGWEHADGWGQGET